MTAGAEWAIFNMEFCHRFRELLLIYEIDRSLLAEIDALELSERNVRWRKAMKAAPWRVYADRERLAVESWKETGLPTGLPRDFQSFDELYEAFFTRHRAFCHKAFRLGAVARDICHEFIRTPLLSIPGIPCTVSR